MKILLAGNWQWQIYEISCAEALRKLGVEVVPFSWNSFFHGIYGKLQRVIPFAGPSTLRMNVALIRAVEKNRPDVLWIWRGTNILPTTLKTIKKRFGTNIISYNNDDPFGPKVHKKAPWHHHFYWRIYIKTLPYFDYNFFYRQINVKEAESCGARSVHLLLPYFVPSIHKSVQLTRKEKITYECDVVFVGHYEPDGREKSIRALLASGINVKLWGGKYWSRAVLRDMYESLSPIVPVEGQEYAKALCGAKVCLCFLSKLNRDTYTRRCFEIPACGKVMLAERTDDLLHFFKEDEEACFFSSPEELVRKAQWLIRNPDIREQIAQAGLRRVWADGHDVASRAKYFLSVVTH
ncbi:MAG: hypothetical protein D3914_02210 [Candidatus Electrothrix sp. LOE2]|nr:hypothetical protein [Candidatus Electrothrix sp. LOE2]